MDKDEESSLLFLFFLTKNVSEDCTSWCWRFVSVVVGNETKTNLLTKFVENTKEKSKFTNSVVEFIINDVKVEV